MELFFFNTEISFSQGKFLLADCEVLACAAGGRDKGASELTRCVRGCGSVMPASKLAAQHSPCTLLRRLPSRDNSSKRVKLLRLMGSPLFPSPYPPPRFVVGSFRFWGRIGYCAVERGRVLLFTRGIFFHTVNSVTSYQFQLPTPNSPPKSLTCFRDTSIMESEIPSFRNPRRMQPFLL